MNAVKMSEIEKEMANFNFDQLTTVRANLVGAATPQAALGEICKVWGSIRKFVVLAENIPVVGKYITILVELLDALCPNAAA